MVECLCGQTHFYPNQSPNNEAQNIADWFGCFLYYNQDSCGSINNGFCSDKNTNNCEIDWANAAGGDQDEDALTWEAAIARGEHDRVLHVPWGRGNRTLDSFMHEVRGRGAWVVEQRAKHIAERRARASAMVESASLP